METKVIIDGNIEYAAKVIKSGGLVAVPTETVYGMAANGLDEHAIAGLYEAKGRPETKPISLFVTDMEMAEEFCRDIPEGAYKLADKFWPGPLTMILKRRDNVPDILTAGGNTVGIRCPDNVLTLELIKKCGLPLTGTSANISGKPNANNIDEVLFYFDGLIECAIDGGACTGGVPSTVVDMTVTPPKVLRTGGITREELVKTIGESVE